MSAIATPPAPAVTPPPGGGGRPSPYRWTLQAYRQLGKTGLFHDIKTILIDGEILVMTMPGPAHNTSLSLTAEYLRIAFPTGHHVRNQMALDIGTRTDPGPDLAVVPGSVRDYANRQATTAVLVVEVSDSTLFFDTTTKAEWYATAGVPEYWVIDLEHRQLIVFRDPQPLPLPPGLGATAYKTHLTLGPADTVSPLAAPAATVLVSDLLP